MKEMIQKILLAIVLITLSACNDAVCLDADDFGFSQVKVSASYAASDIGGSDDSQYAKWIDSGLTLSGNDIHMVVKTWDMLKNINTADELSAWCPWLGPAAQPPSLQDICLMLDVCTFHNNDMCTSQDGEDAWILNAPCILTKGVGLYVMAAPRGFNPNSSEIVSRSPIEDATYGGQIKVLHMGGPNLMLPAGSNTASPLPNNTKIYDLQINPQAGTTQYIQTGGGLIQLSPGEATNLTGGKLWFKILDKYYNDNSGQYIVTVKTGVTTTEWDPTAFAITLVKRFFFGNQVAGDSNLKLNGDGIIYMLFQNVVNTHDYTLLVNTLLTFYVIYYAISFLSGNIQMTHSDLVTRVVKIIIVSQLLTNATAWSFFNQYVFSLFIDGSQSMINLVESAGGAGPGPSSVMTFMLAPHTIIKLIALPMVSWITFGYSIFFVLVFLLSLGIILIALFYAAVIYILCIVMMGLIIALAPIFLCFMLFESTKPLFDNWLKQLVSYALQPILIIAGTTLFGLMIRHQVYQTLGFRVCKVFWLGGDLEENALSNNLRGTASRAYQPYYWAPSYNPSPPETPVQMLIPEAHYENAAGDSVGGYVSVMDPSATFCEPYECSGMRYPSFPFLDPNNPMDLPLLQGFWGNRFAPVGSLAIFLICGVLLLRFNFMATEIAEFITGNLSGQASKAAKKVAVDLAKGAFEAGKVSLKVAKGVATAPYKAVKLYIQIRTRGKFGGKGGVGGALGGAKGGAGAKPTSFESKAGKRTAKGGGMDAIMKQRAAKGSESPKAQTTGEKPSDNSEIPSAKSLFEKHTGRKVSEGGFLDRAMSQIDQKVAQEAKNHQQQGQSSQSQISNPGEGKQQSAGKPKRKSNLLKRVVTSRAAKIGAAVTSRVVKAAAAPILKELDEMTGGLTRELRGGVSFLAGQAKELTKAAIKARKGAENSIDSSSQQISSDNPLRGAGVPSSKAPTSSGATAEKGSTSTVNPLRGAGVPSSKAVDPMKVAGSPERMAARKSRLAAGVPSSKALTSSGATAEKGSTSTVNPLRGAGVGSTAGSIGATLPSSATQHTSAPTKTSTSKTKGAEADPMRVAGSSARREAGKFGRGKSSEHPKPSQEISAVVNSKEGKAALSKGSSAAATGVLDATGVPNNAATHAGLKYYINRNVVGETKGVGKFADKASRRLGKIVPKSKKPK